MGRERLAAKNWAGTRELAGEARPNNFVFCYTDGRPVQPTTFEGWFAKAVEAAKAAESEKPDGGVKLPDLTPHGMRHSHATILLRFRTSRRR